MTKKIKPQAQSIRDRARLLADSIADFERTCRRSEYTDTDAAWELLNNVRRELRSMARQQM